ncbi:MAG: ABC-2 transporter permease [Ruminococcus sp.]|nr:ABC-2 transporter permease [Ruminococcus sp.]
MKCLYVKELWQMRTNGLVYGGLAGLIMLITGAALAALGIADGFFLSWPVFLMAGVAPFADLNDDFKSRWSDLVRTLPARRSDEVGAKYLIALTILGAVSLVYIISRIPVIAAGGMDMGELFKRLALLMSMGSFAPALPLPLAYRWGDRGLKAAYIVTMVLMGMFGGFYSTDSVHDKMSGAGAAVMLGTFAALFGLSWVISARCINKYDR